MRKIIWQFENIYHIGDNDDRKSQHLRTLLMLGDQFVMFRNMVVYWFLAFKSCLLVLAWPSPGISVVFLRETLLLYTFYTNDFKFA